MCICVYVCIYIYIYIYIYPIPYIYVYIYMCIYIYIYIYIYTHIYAPWNILCKLKYVPNSNMSENVYLIVNACYSYSANWSCV